MRMQPYHLYNAEAARLNSLYWTTTYTFERTSAMLRALASVGHTAPDPSVEALWPAANPDVARNIKIPTSKLNQRLSTLLDNLRTTSVLHICSAFENTIRQYMTMAALYRPKAFGSLKKFTPLPALLRKKADFDAARSKAFAAADGILGGPYSRRIQDFCQRFSLNSALFGDCADLDSYYDTRHKIAHSQSLDGVGDTDVELSAAEIFDRTVTVSETSWKQMLGRFSDVITTIDDQVRSAVAKDAGLCLSVYRIVLRDGPISVSKLRSTIQNDWGLNPPKRSILAAASDIGLNTTKARNQRDTIVSAP